MADPTSPTADQPGQQRDSLLRDARRRLAQLEIETHRLRAELARLEADGEDAAAAQLAEQLREQEAELESGKRKELRFDSPAPPPPAPQRENIQADDAPTEAAPFAAVAKTAPAELAPADVEIIVSAASDDRREKPSKSRSLPAWAVSLVTHVILLAALALATMAVQQDTRNFLMANAPDGEDAFDDFAEVSLEAEDLEEVELDELTEELEPSELTDAVVEQIDTPWESAALGAESDNPNALDALPTDIAGLMAGESGGSPDGAAGTGQKPGGGKPASAQFFGARSKGNRFVFVVDNSGSMVDGRMETTILELLNSIGGMKPKQEFHVLFYSDQSYPMFFPNQEDKLIPATRDNRERLRQWLTTVEMCRGGKLKDAMDYAAALRPQVVYLLSDGDYLFLTRNGQRSKTATLRYLTEETSDWPFVIHTLGMTVRDRDDAEALALIAKSHGGSFKPVAVNPLAKRLSLQHRIPYHRTPGTVWGSKVRAR